MNDKQINAINYYRNYNKSEKNIYIYLLFIFTTFRLFTRILI